MTLLDNVDFNIKLKKNLLSRILHKKVLHFFFYLTLNIF
jgi:hypothetical protein